jgi:3-hydroxybutyryl-CoA dehydrogenase
METMTVGILGAGVMGRSLAEAVALSGHFVLLVDVDQRALTLARAEIRAQLRARALSLGLGGQTPTSILERISFTDQYAALSTPPVIVENVTEKVELKRHAYRQLCEVKHVDTIFAVNTSTIPIGIIAELTSCPEQVIGTHFMNPASERHLVEVIPGAKTSESTISKTLSFLHALGKHAVVVADTPGFVSNRVLMLVINEAIQVLEDGVATAENVDKIFVECFGHAMGPLATADLIGLDTILLSLNSLESHTSNKKFSAASLLKAMVAHGRLGRKSGQGFFCYGLSHDE